MNKTHLPVPILITLCLLAGMANSDDRAFRFLAIGDMPYPGSDVPLFHRLLQQSAKEDFEFLIHVGDIKSGGTPCSDFKLKQIRDFFQKYPKPVVYTLGDNEWTDCQAAGEDPIERLAKLRELFFADKNTLRLEKLNAVHQSRQEMFARYVENYRFTKSGVLFVVVHVVGSGNNHRADHPPSMQEYTQRNTANLAFLKESYAEAIKPEIHGVAIVIHANPDFEQGRPEGFKDFLNSFRGFLTKYDRPVICIHGDSHYYRIDKPFRDANGKTFFNFTRMEVFGSPNLAGVSIKVDPTDPQIFSNQPYYLESKQ